MPWDWTDPEWLELDDTLKLKRRLNDEVIRARRRLESVCEDSTQGIDKVRFEAARVRTLKELYKNIFSGAEKRGEEDEAAA